MPILADSSQSYRAAFMRKVLTVAVLLALAFGFSWGLNQVSRRLDQDPQPAGFTRGHVQFADVDAWLAPVTPAPPAGRTRPARFRARSANE